MALDFVSNEFVAKPIATSFSIEFTLLASSECSMCLYGALNRTNLLCCSVLGIYVGYSIYLYVQRKRDKTAQEDRIRGINS